MGKCFTAAETAAQSFEINASYSACGQSLSLSGSAVFLFASSNFILPSSQQSQESNKDDWLHFITAGFFFQEDLQVHSDNRRKTRNKKNYKTDMCSTCDELLEAVTHKQCWMKEINSWFVLLHITTERTRVIFLCNFGFRPMRWQRFLGPVTQEKACFTLNLCHYPPTAMQGRQSRDQGWPGEILSPDIKKDARRDLSLSLPGIQFHSANICQR